MTIVERLRACHGILSGDPDCCCAEAADEIERLTNAIRRIDGINDYPANYSPAINAVCDAILRPHLAAEEPPDPHSSPISEE